MRDANLRRSASDRPAWMRCGLASVSCRRADDQCVEGHLVGKGLSTGSIGSLGSRSGFSTEGDVRGGRPLEGDRNRPAGNTDAQRSRSIGLGQGDPIAVGQGGHDLVNPTLSKTAEALYVMWLNRQVTVKGNLVDRYS